ncbi:MAG: acyltransferase family protein [Candidatus Binatia bacterium]
MTSAAQKIDPLVPAIEPGRPLPSPAGKPPRMLSLDVFRGLTIAAMILVNNPGSVDDVYAGLSHAEWHGWTATDLVFPFFLFIVGIAVTLSEVANRAERTHVLVARIFRRAALLFALGMLLNGFAGFESLATLRIPGVLQRIALCYLAASLIFLATGPAGQAIAAAMLLGGYWALLALATVPGHGAGALDPEGNVAAYLDRRLLGERHLLHGAWDPEGLLSTLPAIGTTLLGVLAGHWLKARRTVARTSLGLVLAGALMAALGALLDQWLPINKNLWTTSYAFFTAGLAAVLLGLCTWLVEAKGVRRPMLPFIVFGVNPIAVYVLSMMVGSLMDQIAVESSGENLRVWLCEQLFTWWTSPLNASLLFAVCYVMFWLGAMSLLYRREIRIKI